MANVIPVLTSNEALTIQGGKGKKGKKGGKKDKGKDKKGKKGKGKKGKGKGDEVCRSLPYSLCIITNTHSFGTLISNMTAGGGGRLENGPIELCTNC